MSPAVRHGTSAVHRYVADGIATALLAGPWERGEMVMRSAATLGLPPTAIWVRVLVDQVLDGYVHPPADRPRELAAYLLAVPTWGLAWRGSRRLRIVQWTPVPTEMGPRRWACADLPDLAALARLLNLDPVDQGELAWFADVRSLERRSPPRLQHYRWWLEPKHNGVRVLSAPKPRLKEIQRRLLRDVFGPIPVHGSAHGCVPGRSVRTAAEPHAGQQVVIRFDLESYFASVRAGRVWGVLRNAGLPEGVAHTITGLVTTVAPVGIVRSLTVGGDPDATHRLRDHLRFPHLPQGAPTSPVIANLVSFPLDRRLAGLAARFDAQYTRYVDDLTFSGARSLAAARSRFIELVEQIVREEGFRLNVRKTIVADAARRQSMLGVVVNDRPTLPRAERDALRALLHNCAVHGWRSQARGRDEFRAYVQGRVAWAAGLDPTLGARLHAAREAIDWT